MLLLWRIDALPALAVAVFAWGAAWFLWTGRATWGRERAAGLLLALMGTVVLADPVLLVLADHAQAAFAAAYVGGVLLIVLPLAQLALVARLPGRGMALLRRPAVAYGGCVVTFLVLVVAVARPDWVVRRVREALAVEGWVALPGVLMDVALAAWLVTLALGAFVAATATTAAEPGRRGAMRSWLAAYASLSIGQSLYVFLLMWSLGDVDAMRSAWVARARHVVAALPLVLFAVFVLQAVARERSVGSRGRARRFVSGTTVVAFFTFPIVVGGEVLEKLIPVPGVVASILVAVLLAVAIRPIQGLADRVARRVVSEPGDDAQPGAAELYRAAIEGAFGDGEINPKEKRTLERLGAQLGLSSEEAERIEAEALGRLRAR